MRFKLLSRGATIFTSSSLQRCESSRRGFLKFSALTGLLTRFVLGANQSTDAGAPTMAHGSDPIVVPAQGQHTGTLIFFHGLGDQGSGWAQVFQQEIRLPHFKYILPNAATRAVTLNFGMQMPAWYDLFGLTEDVHEDEAGIALATKYTHELIDKEIAAGIPANRIMLGGFSMGGALAIYAALTYPQTLGGVVGLSSFLLQRTKLPGDHKANLKTPFFLGHGTNDFLVPLSYGQRTAEAIKVFNPNVTFKMYPCDHSTTSAELKEVLNFMKSHVP
ncbi:phospholipase/Carboxylesterase [Aphelenchoides avenae]|nr:phospholipase/Carboxylesterase [Aphelenchus avenae]